jgi:thioredoxin-dependent peroxiredoxin
MKTTAPHNQTSSSLCLMLSLLVMSSTARADSPSLKVGDRAPDFSLSTLSGEKMSLEAARGDGPVVLVVLRGYPGYQCPLCTRQVGDLISHAKEFKEAGARLLLVYPGPSASLEHRAKEFLQGRSLPEPLMLLTDPDYTFTNLYGLRWEAPNETSYPSTFVIDQKRSIRFVSISKSHGGRVAATEILKTLSALSELK